MSVSPANPGGQGFSRRADRFGLDAAELRALSIPVSLHFMLGVELELFSCALKGAQESKPIKVVFPPLAPVFEKLLRCTAQRLMLSVTTIPVQATATRGTGAESKKEERECVVSGVAELPLLRYVDYLPGKLHLDEIFSRFGVTPLDTPKLAANQDPSYLTFTPHAIAYDKFSPEKYRNDDPLESASSPHVGHYAILEMGLQLATHSHLLFFSLRQPKELDKAIRKFQGFSGWSKFDLRWENEVEKSCGVIVFPTIADAVDLLEAFEDEDESSEENRLPFTLEPVAPCVAVPYMEDTQVKKLRTQHFTSAVKFWENPHSPISVRDRYSVVVSNFSDRISINDLMKLFDTEQIVDAVLYADETPTRRRRVLIHFSSPEATRVALDMDARHYHGAPLRISVSPPYVNVARWGVELISFKGKGKPPAPIKPPAPTASPPLGPASSKGMNVEAKAFIPRFLQSSPQQAPAPLPPPPAYEVLPPPPSYEAAFLPPYEEVAKPPPPYIAATLSPSFPMSSPPPAYNASPPLYSGTPNNSFAAGGSFHAPPPSGPPPMYLPPPEYDAVVAVPAATATKGASPTSS